MEAERSPIEYLHEDVWTWMREIGEEVFVNQKVLLTIVHLGKVHDVGGGYDHWVPVVIDGENSLIRYGDLLGSGISAMPLMLEGAYLSWKEKHTFLDFTSSLLPISKQHDSHSCGLFTYNALDHLVRPESVDLLVGGEAACARMQVFQSITENCLQCVSQSYLQPKSLEAHIHTGR